MISTMTILQKNAEDAPDFDDQYDDDFAPDLYNDGFPEDAEEPSDLDDLYDDDFAPFLYGDDFSEDAEMLQEYAENVLDYGEEEPLSDHDDEDPVLDEDEPLDYDYCKKLLNKVSKEPNTHVNEHILARLVRCMNEEGLPLQHQVVVVMCLMTLICKYPNQLIALHSVPAVVNKLDSTNIDLLKPLLEFVQKISHGWIHRKGPQTHPGIKNLSLAV
ncbi:hypothetical protein OROGR_028114 [Orobanche gracilis]